MPIVIYHANCPDGFCAAFVVHEHVGEATLHPANYGEEPPPVAGQDVYVVDFSYDRETLERMHAEAASLVVLDHHKTAQAALEGLNYCTFDMERSGAMLTWDHFNPGSDIAATPEWWFVPYVQDRDLWQWRLPDSREVDAWLRSWPYEIRAWLGFKRVDANRAAAQGAAIRRYIDTGIQRSAANAAKGYLVGAGHTVADVPIANTAQQGISDLLHVVLECHPDAALAIGWWQRPDGEYQYSLRGRGDYDVSKLAQRYGGGGHHDAAGFEVHEPVHILGSAK